MRIAVVRYMLMCSHHCCHLELKPVRKLVMSISAQGVVERASAELSRRINGLRSGSSAKYNSSTSTGSTGASHQHVTSSSKSVSVIERVTNVLCGGGSATATSNGTAPEKPSRTLLLLTPRSAKKQQPLAPPAPPVRHRKLPVLRAVSHSPAPFRSWAQLLQDDKFLHRLFTYFSPAERVKLAQVCSKWRDTLYRSPRYWSALVPVIQCKELRNFQDIQKVRFYASLLRRGFRSMGLMGATDDDIDKLVQDFPQAAKHIHKLSVRNSSMTDGGLESLLDHFKSLFELELAGCNEITEAGLWSCLNLRIVSLTLTDCINVADEAVGAVAQLLPALYEFSLQAYHVTDTALGYFSPQQSNSLNVLRLNSCWEITNHGIVNIVHALPNLTVLSLSGCSKITDDGVELIAENLHKLRVLDLSWCPRITDAALEYIACDLNQLEELTMDRCMNITDIGIGYVSTMLSLCRLYLRWCSHIRDFGLQHLCSMRNLQVLSLAGCALLTSSGLSSLIQLRQLQELELTNCPGASRELYDYLHEHLPRCLIIE